MSTPISYNGRGSALQVSTDGVSYTTATQLTQFEPDGSKQTIIDQTNLSTVGNFTQKLPVQIDAGEISCEGILNPSDPTILSIGTLHRNLTVAYFRVVLTDGTTYSFQASVSEYKVFSVNVSKVLRYSFKLQIVGAI